MSDVLNLYTIYDHPEDYPHAFVVRRFEAAAGEVLEKELLGQAPTLEGARELVPLGLFNMGREAGDSSVIVETWI